MMLHKHKLPKKWVCFETLSVVSTVLDPGPGVQQTGFYLTLELVLHPTSTKKNPQNKNQKQWTIYCPAGNGLVQKVMLKV